MENFVLNQIVYLAQQNQCNEIIGEYISTAKNGMVKDHFQNLGFTADGNKWKLQVANFSQRECFIKALTN